MTMGLRAIELGADGVILAADYPFLDNMFRRRDTSGWANAGWVEAKVLAAA